MPSLSGMVVWTDEQISDFVRKLGFLDAEGDTEWLIRQFLHLNQVMNDRVVMWYRPPCMGVMCTLVTICLVTSEASSCHLRFVGYIYIYIYLFL